LGVLRLCRNGRGSDEHGTSDDGYAGQSHTQHDDSSAVISGFTASAGRHGPTTRNVVSGFSGLRTVLNAAQTRLDRRRRRLRWRGARGQSDTCDFASGLDKADRTLKSGLLRDDDARCAHAPSPERVHPVAEDAVDRLFTDACRRDTMRAGLMSDDEAFCELVPASELMGRRENADRGKRTQDSQCPGSRPRTKPLQHPDQGYVYETLSATSPTRRHCRGISKPSFRRSGVRRSAVAWS
jgi:hypothetical protein